VDAGGGAWWESAVREDKDYEVGERGVGWEGECKLGRRDVDEVGDAGTAGRDDAEHGVWRCVVEDPW
jgi:hypothetical protein